MVNELASKPHRRSCAVLAYVLRKEGEEGSVARKVSTPPSHLWLWTSQPTGMLTKWDKVGTSMPNIH